MPLSCTFYREQCPRDKGRSLGMHLRVKGCEVEFVSFDKMISMFPFLETATLNPATLMRPPEEPGWIRWSFHHAHKLTLATWKWYKRLNWLGKTVLYFLIVFHILLAAALIYIGPDNLFQHLYDLSQTVRNSTHGWWILAVVMSPSAAERASWALADKLS
jgi:hypothetical protein